MGVIRNLNNITDPFETYVEDILEQIIDDTEDEVAVSRRSRRTRQRAPVVPQPTGSLRVIKHRSGKRYRRTENANFLMSLAEGEECSEISIYDFIPESVSAFTQLLMEKENMEVWNNFLNRSEDEQIQILEKIDKDHKIDLKKYNGSDIDMMEVDGRNAHPAFSAEECFQRIDSDLRTAMKKKHVPLGVLSQLEEKILNFFQATPLAVYKSQFQNSYQRLLLHALCQYMSLYSNSYNEGGTRWTKVQNTHNYFYPPTILLSTYLEKKLARHWCGV